jgi:hypothetical protein
MNLNSIIDWYVHEWQCIPRAVPGPLTQPTKPAPVAEPKQVGNGRTGYVIDATTNTWGFRMIAKPTAGRNPQLTQYDAGLLLQRGYKNDVLNQTAKQVWASGASASEGAKELGVSLDYCKKLWGTFSKAEETEKAGAK